MFDEKKPKVRARDCTVVSTGDGNYFLYGTLAENHHKNHGAWLAEGHHFVSSKLLGITYTDGQCFAETLNTVYVIEKGRLEGEHEESKAAEEVGGSGC